MTTEPTTSLKGEVLDWLRDREACQPVGTSFRQSYTEIVKDLEAGNLNQTILLLEHWRVYWQMLAQAEVQIANCFRTDAEAWVIRMDGWLKFLRASEDITAATQIRDAIIAELRPADGRNPEEVWQFCKAMDGLREGQPAIVLGMLREKHIRVTEQIAGIDRLISTLNG